MKRILAMLLSVICVLSFTASAHMLMKKAKMKKKQQALPSPIYLQQLKTCGSMSL